MPTHLPSTRATPHFPQRRRLAGDTLTSPSNPAHPSNPASPSVARSGPSRGPGDGVLPGATLAGRYRLERMIGSGTSGRVWVAHDEVLRRRVAIKTVELPEGLPRAEAEQIGDRTLREARAIGRLSNPHVVTLHDIITLPSGPAIVMELLDARPLSAILASEGTLSDGAAATVGLAVAAGLMAAHEAGITHRDVKPGNVLVATDGQIKITDFGIARSVGEQTITATGMLLGSPAYIAPEVATGQPATPAADAWGLGALLYACVEGRPPYDRGNAIATLTAVVADPVPPHPRAGRIGVVIDGLLVKDPRRRLAVAAAHDALRGLADDPVGLRLGRPGIAPARSAPGPAVPIGTTSSASPPVVPPGPVTSVPPPVVPTAQVGRSAAPPVGRSLPPPPWEPGSADALRPIPAVAAPQRRIWLIVLAVLVIAAGAVAGYLAVLAIAKLA